LRCPARRHQGRLVIPEAQQCEGAGEIDGYAAVLVRLDSVGVDELAEVIIDAWLTRAPKRLAKEYVDAHLVGRDLPQPGAT
jgi:hypothetical protein